MDPSADPVEIPITDIFDLHAVPVREARAVLAEYLVQARHHGFTTLRIIHGRGIGVQRRMVREVLAGTSFVRSFGDAPAEAGGWGATVVFLVSETAMPTPPALGPLRAQYDAILAEAEQLTALQPAEFHWIPGPGRWSVAECLLHLIAVDTMYAGRLDAAVGQARQEGLLGTGPFRYGWFESWFLRATEPPPGLRVPAPKRVRPYGGGSVAPGEVRERFTALNRELARLAAEAEGLDWQRARMASPLASWWKLSLGVALALPAAHDRRHLWQAQQVTASPGFPGLRTMEHK